MNASVNNAALDLIKEDLIKEDLIKEESAPTPSQDAAPSSSTECRGTEKSGSENLGHEALQALLAFSALHQQIRTRRPKQMRDGAPTTPDDWRLEQFVLDEVLQLVAVRALAITGADGIAIALAEDDAIVCRASAGSIAPDAGVRLDPNSGFSGECLASGRIVRCDDAETDPRVDLLACRRLGVRSLLAVPLSAKQIVIGLLEAFSNEPYGFNDSDVRSLNLLSELILSALRPEEEDRLSEISRRVVSEVAAEPIPAAAPMPEIEPVQAVKLTPSVELPSALEKSEDRSLENSDVVSQKASESSNGPVIAPIESAPIRDAAIEKEIPDHSLPGLTVVAAVVLCAVALGAGVWWTLGHRTAAVKASARATAPMATPEAAPAKIADPPSISSPTVTNAVTETSATVDERDAAPATAEEAGVMPQVTGIRHWSSADSSTVVIDIQDQVQYEAHRLSNPERIYFDLHDTALATTFSARTITINDALLQRIRVAQPIAGVTRVVLETNEASDFSVSLEPNPYRLLVEVRKLGARPSARAKIDLFAPSNPQDQSVTQSTRPTPASTDQLALNQKPLNQIPLNQIPPNKLAVESATPKPFVLNQIPLTPIALNSSASKQTLSAPGNEKLAAASPADIAAIPAPIYAAKLRIVLDAGHGGWDLGTVGRQGLLEKDLVLDIVERLGRMVEARLGAEVIYTRKDDSYLALEKRAEIANLAQANLFVSVHANYSDFPSARGVETYYTNTYSSVKARTEDDDAGLQAINWTNVDIREKVTESRRVAASVQHALYTMLSAKNPGLPNRGVKEAHYVVLTGTSMPAILAEVSFVSSPTDENNLQSSTYRQQIAEALYTGIARYEASNRNVKMASNSAKPPAR
jgi:N-acetylmuramoyl-L-alanine amidase